MQLHVLGNVHLYFNDKPVHLGSGRERELLTLLALANGHPLPAEELANRLWDTPPPTYRSTLHTYITRLRRRLEAAGIERSLLSHGSDGYQLGLASEDIDWGKLENSRGRASALRRADDHAAARAVLREALRLQKGRPLSGLSGRWLAQMRVTMERAHQDVLVDWARLTLDAGDAAEVLTVLDDALMLYPTNEALHGCVLRALRALGRSADALMVYQQLKQRLAEELGVDPSADVRREFEQILQATTPRADLQRPGEEPQANTSTTPVDNLDRDQKLFRGRETELLLLTSRLRDQTSPTPHIWIVSGMAGVGKSSLAMRVAHRVKDAFPQVRLNVDLRGHHGQLAPLAPGEAIIELLQLLRIPARHIPKSFSEQVALWREHTRSMRMLLILDDAASADQVAPLLPVGAGSAVLVTSRFQLPEIGEAEHLPLGLPSLSESVEMFAAASGRSLWSSDPNRTLLEDVITRCGRLPLVLRLVATMLRLRPSWSLQALLERLHVEQNGVGAFRVGHLDLERVFELALRAVSPHARAAFLRLGLHPTRIMCAPVAVALIGLEERSARQSLDELVGACLLEEHKPNRFRLHTLLKSHAFHTARRALPSEAIQAVHERMHEAYLTSSQIADGLLHPHRPGRDSEDLPPNAVGWDRTRAETWFRSELPTLLTVIHTARNQGQEEIAGELAHSIAEYLDLHGPWHTAPALHERASVWFQEHEEVRKAARANFDLGRALLRRGDVEQALHHNLTAQKQWANVEDRLGKIWSLAQRGLINYVAGRYDQSLKILKNALECFEVAQHRSGIVFALRNRGLCHFAVSSFPEAVADLSDVIRVLDRAPDPQVLSDVQLNLAGALRQLGFHREAWNLCETALESAQANSDDRRCAFAWTNLGELSLHRQRPEQAIECLTQALACLERFHDPWSKPTALCNMGTAYTLLGQLDNARSYFQRSLDLRGFSQPTTLFDTHLGLAQIEQASGKRNVELDHLRKAVNIAVQHGLRKEHAQALHALGQCLMALGRRRESKAHLSKAASLYEELGAPEATVVRSLLDAQQSP